MATATKTATFSFPNATDLSAVIEVQKRNFEAFKKASELVSENAKTVVARQAALAQDHVNETIAAARDLIGATDVETAVKKQVAFSQAVAEKAQAASKEIYDLSVKNVQAAFDVLRSRAEASVAEVSALVKAA